jgi:DNA repair exonuclease SbcCD ATPase subunit
MSNEDRFLPVLDDGLDDPAPVCSPKIYVSNEEAALLAGMRRLRDRSLELRRQLKDSKSVDRARLETELRELREQWRALAERREEAFRQKMIMLGHLPPEDPVTP